MSYDMEDFTCCCVQMSPVICLQDDGEEFVYSGSGGRDLSGNKRKTKEQSMDQRLTAMNK